MVTKEVAVDYSKVLSLRSLELKKKTLNNFRSRIVVLTSPGAHPLSCPMGTEGKAAEA
jgi:hypothetical protein